MRAMTVARLYQRPKSAMQSGRARTREWVLEPAPSEPRRHDPLTGWWGSGDTRTQLALRFPSRAAAEAYAAARGWTVDVAEPWERTLKLQAYADNFR
jgi:hypothetical protein